MKSRAWLRFAAITATAMLAAGSVATAGPGGGHGGGGGGHGGVAGFHGGGPGAYSRYYGGYGWRGGFYGGYGRWCCGWGLGFYVPFLPWYYDTYWWGDVPYYYADGAYYLWNSGVGQYEAVDPPGALSQTPPQGRSAASAGTPAVSSELFAYPKAGQSPEQQKQDKEECRRWAAAQTGFDPTQTSGAAAKGAGTNLQGYLRAQAACLEGRNYSVR
jgi:hypothetical protein